MSFHVREDVTSSPVGGQLHVPAALPMGNEPPVTIVQEAGLTPEPVWTTWGKENPTPTGTRTRTPCPPCKQPVAILSYPGYWYR
jgi:hypothetical protein